jgi:hypothetical protein
MLFEEIDGPVPVFARFVLAPETVVGGTERGVKAADLTILVRAVFQLVDGLPVVVAGVLEVAEFAVDIAADFEGGSEGVDAVEVWAEGLLAFFHGGGCGVECLIKVSSGAESGHTIL